MNLTAPFHVCKFENCLVITQAAQHEFQILTKRASRMAEVFQTRQVPKNAWLGVTPL